MGRKDASTIKLPVDQYRKQIGKQWIPLIYSCELRSRKRQLCIILRNTFSLMHMKYMNKKDFIVSLGVKRKCSLAYQ
jgi:hypothetical protein